MSGSLAERRRAYTANPSARRMKRPIVLNELAFALSADGTARLYVAHPNRLQKFSPEQLRSLGLPNHLVESLGEASRYYDARRTAVQILDERWRRTVDVPYILFLRADGTLERIQESFNKSWRQLVDEL